MSSQPSREDLGCYRPIAISIKESRRLMVNGHAEQALSMYRLNDQSLVFPFVNVT